MEEPQAPQSQPEPQNPPTSQTPPNAKAPTSTTKPPTEQQPASPKKCNHMPIIIALVIVAAAALAFGGFELYLNLNNNSLNNSPSTGTEGSSHNKDYLRYAEKPVIYLYPEQTTEVSVKLGHPEDLTVSYPLYKDGWRVLAQPNGDLKYLEDGRELYALYYESKSNEDFVLGDDGFVVAGKDSAKFLEDKLAKLGLNAKETEEFIIYWLPRLEANKYNFIHFATQQEIDQNLPLEIDPAPNSIIRIWMTFKGLDEKISVPEQTLTVPTRTGFTVVEWGGIEL